MGTNKEADICTYMGTNREADICTDMGSSKDTDICTYMGTNRNLQEAPKALRKIHHHQTRTQLMVSKLTIYHLERVRTQDLKTDLYPPSSVVMAMHEAKGTKLTFYQIRNYIISERESVVGSDSERELVVGSDSERELVVVSYSERELVVGSDSERESVVGSDSERECMVVSDSERESVVGSDSERECGVCITAPVIPWAKILGSQWTGRGVTGKIRFKSWSGY
uniref:Uncharacterized protein n=1 Tax=Timema tahoe TaxID=61484 RepID=A0A7R9IH57_9NEOP|nr:unnamed protein product [Timema tahoe]